MKYLILSFVSLLSIVFTSCEENFSPKMDYKEEFIVYAVLESNIYGKPAIQYAVVSKTYDVNGYSPNENTVDPNISNAKVTISIKDRVYSFKPDSTKRADTTRYTNRFHYYKLDTTLILNNNDAVALKAVLPNGKILSAAAVVPSNLFLEYSYDFTFGFTADVNKLVAGNSWDIYWEPQETGHLFTPRLLLSYTVTNDSVVTNKSVEIPYKYSDNKPVYPPSSFDYSISYDYSAFDVAMAAISEGDPDKSKYKIGSLVLSILDYNPPLAKFYSSTNGSLDQYSIRLDESTYSNIAGGIGIFGIFKNNETTFYLRAAYIKKFGYK